MSFYTTILICVILTIVLKIRKIRKLPATFHLPSRRKVYVKGADLSQHFHYRFFLARMQPDATHIQKHSHKLTQFRRYRARFSYKFPHGGTPDATSCLALLSSVSLSSPVPLPIPFSLLLHFHSFLPSCISHTNCVPLFHFIFYFHTFLIIDIRQEMYLLCATNCLCVGLNVNKCQPVVLITVCATACMCSNEIGWQHSGLLSYGGSYDAHYQLYIHTKHMSTIIHTDWGLPPDLTH